ncbi:MAG TPA: cytosine permease [Steroidobacteraceae bacterium]|nr:cytosine permease [Steroidobacteraceae bacterium]
MTSLAPSADRVGHVEARGIEFVPEQDRHGKPFDLAAVFFGAQLTYGSIIIGALPIAFGLNVAQSLSAILLGTLVGALCVAAMALLGPRSGTNSVVASGAFFGIRGRHVGSTITEVIDLGYFGMALWVSATQLVQLLHLTAGVADGSWSRFASIVICALLILIIGLFGHATIVAYQKVISCVTTVMIAIIVLACWLRPMGHPPVPGHYQFGGFWGSWTLAVSTSIANAISYAPFAGDYARYLPARTAPVRTFCATLFGMVFGCALGIGAGVTIALHVADPFSVTSQMVMSLPLVILLPVSLATLAANLCSGGMVVYNGILSLHAVLFRLRRTQVAYLFGALGLALGYFGLIVNNMADSILALCSVVTTLVTPWIVINILGYFRSGGRFDVVALQCFASPTDGRYSYTRGVNVPAVLAWALAVIVGLPFSANSLFVGPAAAYFHGVDLSVAVSALVGALTYSVFGRAAPYPLAEAGTDAARAGAVPTQTPLPHL